MARSTNDPASLFRVRTGQSHHRVTNVELLFDLVFVYAVTQLSHRLLEDFTSRGAEETSLLTLAVWWVWVYTSWVTNWLDPERRVVRLMLFALMFAGLLLSIAIPGAFETHGLLFAATYVTMQVGRSVFMIIAARGRRPNIHVNFLRVCAWLLVAAVFWLGGTRVHGSDRLLAWGIALGVEYTGPLVAFWTPGLGRSDVNDWRIEGGHLSERCAGFVIIALGESVVSTGATFAKGPLTQATTLAFGASFLTMLAMWWIYFDKGAEVGSERITHSKTPGRLARLAYTYLHLPMVIGIILSAVGDELVLAHPEGHVERTTVIALVGSPLIFLLGALLFKHAVRLIWQLSHGVGILALIALAVFASHLTPLQLSEAATGVLVVVAIWETRSLGLK